MESDFNFDTNRKDCLPVTLPGGNTFASHAPLKVLDFSSCKNIVPPPKKLVKSVKNARIDMRSDPFSEKALANLANKFSLSPENVVAENTVFGILNLIIKSLKIRNAGIVTPCEVFYKDICRLSGCGQKPFVMSERSNFTLDCDALIEWLSSRFDALIISNPNTVTGRVVPKNDMLAILDYCQSKGIYVVVDESYMDFVLECQSVAGCVNEYRNAVVISSPAEYHGLSGINAVCATASSEVSDILSENRLPWQLDAQASALLENAYKFEKFNLKTKKWIFKEKSAFVKKLKQFGSLKITHSDCHYLLIKLDEVSATNVYNRLLKSNILIRDVSSVTGLDGSYIRISVRNAKDNELFAEELARCLI